jgi:hypothetical protein
MFGVPNPKPDTHNPLFSFKTLVKAFETPFRLNYFSDFCFYCAAPTFCDLRPALFKIQTRLGPIGTLCGFFLAFV